MTDRVQQRVAMLAVSAMSRGTSADIVGACFAQSECVPSEK